MPKTKEQTIDLNIPLENCLRSDPEFVKACERMNELEQEVKKLEMAISFNAYDEVLGETEKERQKKLIENERLGKPNQDNQVLMKPEEIVRNSIARKKLALEEQKKIVKAMKVTLWQEGIERYEATARSLFENLINNAEQFLKSLWALKKFQERLQNEAEIKKELVPWRIDETYFREFGIYDNDGNGALRNFIELSRKRLDNAEKK